MGFGFKEPLPHFGRGRSKNIFKIIIFDRIDNLGLADLYEVINGLTFARRGHNQIQLERMGHEKPFVLVNYSVNVKFGHRATLRRPISANYLLYTVRLYGHP